MKRKKRAVIWTAVCAACVIFAASSRSLGNDADGHPNYSSQNANNIGAWYDETWTAVKCKVSPRPHDPDAGGTVGYQDCALSPKPSLAPVIKGSASMPPDIVVTEWAVTGHVHFASDDM